MWICIILSIVIYAAVGYHVFHHRNQLRNAGLNSAEKGSGSGTHTSSDAGDSAVEALTPQHGFYGTAVTEVHITADPTFDPRESQGSIVLQATPNTTGGHGRSCVPSEAPDRNEGTASRHHFATVCSSDCRRRPSTGLIGRLRNAKSHASLKLRHLDPVKMAYLRTSFIFAFAVLITWIPSSVNRIYSLTHGGTVSFQLSVASGCVLPLQGVWNALIYFTTSWTPFCEETKSAWKSLVPRRGSTPDSMQLNARISRYQSPVEHRDTFERLRHPRLESNSSDRSDDDFGLGNYGCAVPQSHDQYS